MMFFLENVEFCSCFSLYYVYVFLRILEFHNFRLNTKIDYLFSITRLHLAKDLLYGVKVKLVIKDFQNGYPIGPTDALYLKYLNLYTIGLLGLHIQNMGLYYNKE